MRKRERDKMFIFIYKQKVYIQPDYLFKNKEDIFGALLARGIPFKIEIYICYG